MKKNRIFSILLAVVIILTSAPTMASAKFVDMPNNWARPGLENAVKNGLMHGHDGKIRPNDTLTRAEMAAVSSRMLGLRNKANLSSYSDVDSSKWYYDEMSKAVAAGIMEGSNGKLYPNDPIKREEVFVILGRILDLSQGKKPSKTIVDYDEISSWSRNAINALVDANYIQGDHENKMNAKQNITRAEFATALDNIVREYIQKSGLVDGKVVNGNLVINKPNVKLKNVKVKGDLILAEGIDPSEIDLTNVEVEGRILVRGGKRLELIKSEADTIRVLDNAGDVKIVVNKDSHVNEVNTDTKIKLKGDKKDLTAVFNKGQKVQRY